MSEKEPSSPQTPERKAKGFYLPHYPDSDKPSAMQHPAYGELDGPLPDLATMQPLGEHAPSDPEIALLTQAFNKADGQLPETPQGELLQTLPATEAGEKTLLASISALDEKSNGIIYLRLDKFVYGVDLCNYTTGRDTPKNGGSSKKAIEASSRKPSNTAPPVLHVQAFYEEKSGHTYYALVGDGTHRLAAAYQRPEDGVKYVPASSVSFYRLEGSSISEQLEELAASQAEQVKQKRRHIGRVILERLKR